MTTERLVLTKDPVQITDGTNNAHVTVSAGSVLYADSADSTAWHIAGEVMNITPPLEIYMKAYNGNNAAIVVTIYSD